MTPANNEIFQQFVIGAVPVSDIEKAIKGRPSEDRNKTLLKATLLVNRHIEKKAAEFASTDAARDYLVGLIQYLTDTVQVVRFVLPGDNAAYTIFETLNDRGLELAPLDLVKNYVFSRAEKYRVGSLRDFEERWAEMMTLLGSMKVDSFLRAFWASRHGTMEGPNFFLRSKRPTTTLTRFMPYPLRCAPPQSDMRHYRHLRILFGRSTQKARKSASTPLRPLAHHKCTQLSWPRWRNSLSMRWVGSFFYWKS